MTDLARATDWASWTPGDPSAARKAADGGLRDLLDKYPDFVKGIGETTLDRIGNVIGDGLGQGLPISDVAARVNDFLDDPGRAFLIAQTESSRAMVSSQADQYQEQGWQQFDWIAYDGACDECGEMEDSNPHDFSDDQPPGHPSCRCGIVGSGELTTPEGEGDQPDTSLGDEMAQMTSAAVDLGEQVALKYATKAAATRDLQGIRTEMLDGIRAEREARFDRLGQEAWTVRVPKSAERLKGGENDWWNTLSKQEQTRLVQTGHVVRGDKGSTSTMDQLQAVLRRGEEHLDFTAQTWLEEMRKVDLADTVMSRKVVPTLRVLEARYGGVDPQSISPSETYKVQQIFARKDEAIESLMRQRATDVSDAEASHVLSAFTADAELGTSPYEMSLADYTDELNVLRGAAESIVPISDDPEFGPVYDAFDQQILDRLDKFWPRSILAEMGETSPSPQDVWLAIRQAVTTIGRNDLLWQP